MAFAWGFAVVWNLVSTPLLFVFRNRPGKDYVILVALLFPAIGVLLLIRAIRLSLEFRKYGMSNFVMSSVPGVVGGKLQGSIYAAFDPRSERSAKVKFDLYPPHGHGHRRRSNRRVADESDEAGYGPMSLKCLDNVFPSWNRRGGCASRRSCEATFESADGVVSPELTTPSALSKDAFAILFVGTATPPVPGGDYATSRLAD